MWRVGKNLPSSTAARNHTKLITTFSCPQHNSQKAQTGKTQSPINWTTPNTSGEDKHTSQCSSTADDATEISEAGNRNKSSAEYPPGSSFGGHHHNKTNTQTIYNTGSKLTARSTGTDLTNLD